MSFRRKAGRYRCSSLDILEMLVYFMHHGIIGRTQKHVLRNCSSYSTCDIVEIFSSFRDFFQYLNFMCWISKLRSNGNPIS